MENVLSGSQNTLTEKKQPPDFRFNKVTAVLAGGLFFLCAFVAVLSLGVILFYILREGLPLMFKVGVREFLLGTRWAPLAKLYGVLPMIAASTYSTLGAIFIGVPVGVLTAVFLAETAPPRLAEMLRPLVQLLAAIPSVVYGFFGLVVLVPVIDSAFGGGGNSLLAVILVLGVMILPTIISVAETAISAVPRHYREGSLALGASKTETVFKVVIPAAKSGILAAIVLGIGRAVGETMAVMLVAGNTARMPTSLLQSVRTLTANCALEMGYASGDHQKALFTTGVVLLVFIMLLNVTLSYIGGKQEAGE